MIPPPSSRFALAATAWAAAAFASADDPSAITSRDDNYIYGARFTSEPFEDDIMIAIDRCESDLTCAGISLSPNGTVSGTRLYAHSFVGPHGTDKTYETRKKAFTYHGGKITGGAAMRIEERGIPLTEAKRFCESDPDCVAFTYPARSLMGLNDLPNVTFVSTLTGFRAAGDGGGDGDGNAPESGSESDSGSGSDSDGDWRTYVSNDPARSSRVSGEVLTYDEGASRRPYRGCCDRTDLPPISEVSAADDLERISCDLSREEFFLRYESRRRPVMLVGCEEGWPAVDSGAWNPETLVGRFGNDTRWRARMGEREEGGLTISADEDYNRVRWGDIVEAMQSDRPYYVFDQLGDPEAKVIDDEYDDPKPVKGGDLYGKLPHFMGPLRWFNVGPRNTGTRAHTVRELDPL